MTGSAMKQDIEAVYRLADGGVSLSELMQAIEAVLERHPQELAEILSSYRLQASDTGYTTAFSIHKGQYRALPGGEATEVTVVGKEQDLLLVFQRKLTPLAALLRGKIKVKGDKGALLKLGEFL